MRRAAPGATALRELCDESVIVRRRPSHYPVISACALVIALAAGCGSNTPPSVPRSIVITAPPVPVGTLVAGCDASELETWYEVAGTLANRFDVESMAALDQPADTLPDTLSRQSDLIDRILAEPVPECAGTAHAAIIQRLKTIRAAFTAFYEGQIDGETLRTRVTAEHGALTTEVATMLGDLAAGMDALSRWATQTAAPGG